MSEPTTIRRYIPVTSSQLASVGYDPSSMMLAVVFKNAPLTAYLYSNVTAMTYAELLNAESLGVYFSTKIKAHPDKYPFIKQAKETNDA